MTRQTLADLPSLELVERLIKNRQAIEQSQKGGHRWRRMFRQNPETLTSESRRLSIILRQHYEGIIGEIFWRGSDRGPVDSSAVIQFCVAIFSSFPQQICTLTDGSTFSTTLWRLVDERMNAQFGPHASERALALKPKFMLRQFIDDLPSGEPRGVLRAFAYDHGPDPGDGIAIEGRALLYVPGTWWTHGRRHGGHPKKHRVSGERKLLNGVQRGVQDVESTRVRNAGQD